MALSALGRISETSEQTSPLASQTNPPYFTQPLHGHTATTCLASRTLLINHLSPGFCSLYSPLEYHSSFGGFVPPPPFPVYPRLVSQQPPCIEATFPKVPAVFLPSNPVSPVPVLFTSLAAIDQNCRHSCFIPNTIFMRITMSPGLCSHPCVSAP